MYNINIHQSFFVQDSVSTNIKKSELNLFKANCAAKTLTMIWPRFTF